MEAATATKIPMRNCLRLSLGFHVADEVFIKSHGLR